MYQHDDVQLARRVAWLEQKVTRLIRSVIAAAAAFLAWQINAVPFPRPLGFHRMGWIRGGLDSVVGDRAVDGISQRAGTH